MRTYEAIIDGDKVTWVGEAPQDPKGLRGTFQVSEPIQGTDGKLLVKLLEDIRAEGGVTGFGDAAEWQRQERIDRPLPGRES